MNRLEGVDLSNYAVTSPLRRQRLKALMAEARDLVEQAKEELILADKREVAGVCLLFSGGNDSTTLVHLFKDVATHAVHANTGIGIEQTRQFVRDRCKEWGLPLMEVHPGPGNTYEELVLDQGFPGPAHHWKMYQRLKERGLREARRQLVTNPYKQRVLFIAGRRRSESERRKDIPAMERIGSTVWVSPLVEWTKADLNTYRAIYDVPRNEVSDLLHMSGECLCGAFAKRDELDEIGMWFPEVRKHIEELERKVSESGKVPEKLCKWGWGKRRTGNEKSGPLCTSCDARFTPPEDAA